MGIAKTNSRLIYRSVLAPTRLSLISEVNASLQAVGWTSTAVTGGYKLLGVSPQGRGVYLYVRDLGHAFGFGGEDAMVTFNFEAADGSVMGIDHEVVINHDRTFQMVAGQCQLFLSTEAMAFNSHGSHVCGGVPYVPGVERCQGDVPAELAPTQVFWSMGDGSGDAGPRSSLILNNDMMKSEALWGTNYCEPGDVVGSLRIPTLTPANSLGIFHGLNFPSPVLYRNGDFFDIEPMLSWGLTNNVKPKARAQIWDAMIFSKQLPMDTITVRQIDLRPYRFINFTDNYLFGGINLILPTGSSSGLANYAYHAN